MKIKVEVIKGVEGHSLYVNDYRVLGAKPWGGGELVVGWNTEIKDFKSGIKEALKTPNQTIKKSPNSISNA